MGLTLQPAIFERLVDRDAFHFEGLLARFLYVYPSTDIGFRKTGRDRPSLDESAKESYQAHVHALFQKRHTHQQQSNGHQTLKLPLNESALDQFHDFEAWVEQNFRSEGELSDLPKWGLKLPGQAARVAGLLALGDRIRWNPEGLVNNLRVNARHMDRAITLVRTLIPHARRTLTEVQPNSRYKLAQRVLKHIEEIDPDRESMTLRDLYEKCKGHSKIKGVSDLRAITDHLEAHNILRLRPQSTSGPGRKPSPLVEVNPKYSL